MNKIILWYNKNRRLLWTVIIVILAMFLFVRILSYFNTRNRQTITQGSSNTVNMQEEINNNLNEINLDSDKSTVTGDHLSQSQTNKLTIIDEFITACNDGNTESAYELLSAECKEKMYPTLESFINNYYNQVFGVERKNVSIENWVDNIYKININEDSLSTGIYSEENSLQDYYTIVNNEQDNTKININSFIDREETSASKQTSDLEMELLEIDTYMDYQIYKIRVKNNTQNTILLDDKVSTDSMYLVDENGIHYSAYSHEITEPELTLSPNETKEIEIKYYNRFISTKKIVGVNFSRIQLNYNNTNVLNQEGYNRYTSFELPI